MSSIFTFAFTLLFFLSLRLEKPWQKKFQAFGESKFGGSKTDRQFLKIPKWQHKLVWEYEQGKLVSYF